MNHRLNNSEHEALKVQPVDKSLPRTSEHSKVQPASKILTHTSEPSKVQPASKVLPYTNEPSKVQPPLKDGHNTHTAIRKSSISDKEQRIHLQHTPINQGSVRPSEPQFDSSKAFTGSIVERPQNIDSNPRGQSSSSLKTVSRFKMQRKQL